MRTSLTFAVLLLSVAAYADNNGAYRLKSVQSLRAAAGWRLNQPLRAPLAVRTSLVPRFSLPASASLQGGAVFQSASGMVDFDGSPFSAWKRDTALELDSLIKSIETNYAPLQLKKTTVGLDWDSEKAKAKAGLQAIATPENAQSRYYDIVAELFHAFKDAHVGVKLPGNLKAVLPVQFSYVDGKTVVSFIDREALPEDKFPFHLGDRLARMDGKTPEDLRAELNRYVSVGNKATDLALATRYLSLRPHQTGVPVPSQDHSKLVIESNGKAAEYEIDWKRTGVGVVGEKSDKPVIVDEKAPETAAQPLAGRPTQPSARAPKSLAPMLDMLAPLGEWFEKFHLLMNVSAQGTTRLQALAEEGETSAPKKEGRQFSLGDQKPSFALPSNFKEVRLPAFLKQLAPSNLYAGVFERDGQKIGLLRIASFIPGTTPQELVGALLTARYYIQYFQDKTDKLVIDQTYNPGGMVVFVDWLVSSLTTGNYSFKPMTFEVKPTESWMQQYAQVSDALTNDASIRAVLTADQIAKFKAGFDKNKELVAQAYKNGHHELSKPISLTVFSEFMETLFTRSIAASPLGAVDAIKKLLVNSPYTKPIAVMINELCFSGGDAFPSIMQDNKGDNRIRLVGVNTAGAGGSVGEFHNQVENPIEYHMTQSLMKRASGGYVENAGAVPDVPVPATAQDYRDGFQSYLDRVLQALGWAGKDKPAQPKRASTMGFKQAKGNSKKSKRRS